MSKRASRRAKRNLDVRIKQWEDRESRKRPGDYDYHKPGSQNTR